MAKKKEATEKKVLTLDDVGIVTDGVCYWMGGKNDHGETIRRQRGPVDEEDGQNGFTAEQIKLISADITKQEKKDAG